MTSPAIQLARECGAGFKVSAGNQVQLTIFGGEELERFYALAQAQALRDAAEAIYKGMPPNKARDMLRRMAEELEGKA